MTLVELLVAMGIFTIVLSVFMGGLVIMTRNTARTQGVAEAGDSVRLAFQRMDKQVRYASAINRPGAGPSGARYVEFRTTAVDAGDSPFCTQWRYAPSTGLLQLRTWDDVPAATPGAWHTIIDDVRNDLVAPDTLEPFEFVPADSTVIHQRLTVRLDVGRRTQPGAQTESTFVARNSSSDSLSNADLDHNGASDSPVCLSASGRP